MAILEVQDLTVEFDKFKLSNITFSCSPGVITALVGKNGAGKTTTIDTILGLIKPCSGVIRYDGEVINEKNIDRFKQRVGYVGNYTNYYPDVSVKRIVKFLSGLYAEWDQPLLNHYLELFQIDITKKIGELSTGTKVKFSLAVALSHSAKLFILDEPTTGLDPIVREQVLTLLKSLAREVQAAVFFSSHITQDIEKIASRIMFIMDGKVVLNTSKNELYSQYIKMSLYDLSCDHDDILPKGVKVSDQYVVMNIMDIPAGIIKQKNERAPLLIEDVLIYLNGGIA